jgi:hypothetical protein
MQKAIKIRISSKQQLEKFYDPSGLGLYTSDNNDITFLQ